MSWKAIARKRKFRQLSKMRKAHPLTKRPQKEEWQKETKSSHVCKIRFRQGKGAASLGMKDAINKGFYWLIYTWHFHLHQTRGCVWGKSIILIINNVVANNQVSIDHFAAFIAEFIVTWLSLFCFHSSRLCYINVNPTQIMVCSVCGVKGGWRDDSELITQPFGWGNVIMIIELSAESPGKALMLWIPPKWNKTHLAVKNTWKI